MGKSVHITQQGKYFRTHLSLSKLQKNRLAHQESINVSPSNANGSTTPVLLTKPQALKAAKHHQYHSHKHVPKSFRLRFSKSQLHANYKHHIQHGEGIFDSIKSAFGAVKKGWNMLPSAVQDAAKSKAMQYGKQGANTAMAKFSALRKGVPVPGMGVRRGRGMPGNNRFNITDTPFTGFGVGNLGSYLQKAPTSIPCLGRGVGNLGPYLKKANNKAAHFPSAAIRIPKQRGKGVGNLGPFLKGSNNAANWPSQPIHIPKQKGKGFFDFIPGGVGKALNSIGNSAVNMGGQMAQQLASQKLQQMMGGRGIHTRGRGVMAPGY